MRKNKKLLKTISFILITSFSLLISGCARQDKQERKVLINFTERSNDYESIKNDVFVGVKLLTEEEINTIFKSPSSLKRSYLSKKYSAIQLSIQNNSTNDYWLNNSSFDIKTFSSDEVKKIFETGYLLSAPTFVPSYLAIMLLSTLLTTVISVNLFVLAGLQRGGCPVVLLGPIFVSLLVCALVGIVAFPFVFKKHVKKKNRKIRETIFNQVFDLDEKPYAISQGEEFQKIIFTTKKDLEKPSFLNLILFDFSKSSLVFMIPLKQTS